MTITAEYTKASRSRSAVVTIAKIEGGRREVIEFFNVTGKREARMIAKDCRATPWNF